MKKIFIIGNGGLAKEIRWLIDCINQSTCEWKFLGYIDKDYNADDVVGDDAYMCSIKEEVFAVLAMADPLVRSRIYEKYKRNEHIHFPNIISPSAHISDSVHMGEGNIVCDNCVMTVSISMGNFNIVNYGCTVGHNVNIGNFNIINPGTNISGNVEIHDYVQVGTGTKVIQGKMIDSWAIIGAGAVVVKDVLADTTVAGVPAKIIKHHEKDGSI